MSITLDASGNRAGLSESIAPWSRLLAEICQLQAFAAKRITAILLHSLLGFLAVCSVIAVCALASIGAHAADSIPAPTLGPGADNVRPVEIPLADIAARATEVANLINSLTVAAEPGSAFVNIAQTLAELSKRLDEQLALAKATLETEPTLEILQALQQQWQRLQLDTTAQLNSLTQQATKLQNGLNQIGDLRNTWNTTRSSAQAAAAPSPIIKQIDTTLEAISSAQEKLQTERSAVLDLQSRIAQEVNKCTTVLAQIGQYQQKAVTSILLPDAPPLWRVELWADALKALPDHAAKMRRANWADFAKYLRDTGDASGHHGALFIVLVLLFTAARRRIAAWEKAGLAGSAALSVFDRPYSAALASALLFATSPFFQLANAVRQVLTLVALVPMLRLVQPSAGAQVVAAFHVAGVLFAVETLRQAYGSIQVIGQALLVLETFAAIVALISLRRHYQQFLAQSEESSRVILLKSARILVIGGLTFSLLAGTAGYVRLARLLTPAILVGGVLALAAYAYLRVLGGLVALSFRLWPLRLLRMVQHHRDNLERRCNLLLVWIAIAGWTVRYLGYLGLLDNAWSLVQALLSTKLERGTLSISISDILEFLLAVFSAYLLSRFLRFALQEDVYPRIDLAPGLSYAVSSLLNYIVLALGFLAGLAVLGVDFSKISIMAGAFGVGIGFGLQSIVNNFVSGLILLFERPIHVGDTVEVGSLQGTVRRIGIRASVIRTLAGADIIVPNSQLVTEKVTNWTLSDRLRRIDLPVGVNYGADPKKVIELLVGVANAHPKVMTKPPANAFLLNYGDSSINFELRAWTDQSSSQAEIRSDLATAVYDAVKAAGMSFPFPQREVRIVSDLPSEPARAQIPDSKKA